MAALVLHERERSEYLNVAAGLAVLAGIAASDAICCARLSSPDLKDEAHYGLMIVAPRRARDADRWAKRLVERAAVEVER